MVRGRPIKQLRRIDRRLPALGPGLGFMGGLAHADIVVQRASGDGLIQVTDSLTPVILPLQDIFVYKIQYEQ